MSHTIRDKKALLTRVRRIAGQAAALEKALEQESECAAILQQIAAIRGAVNGLMGQVLEHHIREHLGATDCTPQQRQQDLEVVLTALRSYPKEPRRQHERSEAGSLVPPCSGHPP